MVSPDAPTSTSEEEEERKGKLDSRGCGAQTLCCK
jgi:hypothetical protein